jgi:hypothetical protein
MSSATLPRSHLRSLAATALALGALLGCTPSPPPAATAPSIDGAQTAVEVINGTLDDGTQWAVAKPARWNGTLVLDLDGANFIARRNRDAQPSVDASATKTAADYFDGFTEWLVASGYAYGGITREPVGYDYPKAVAYLLTTRDRAIDAWGEPRRTLVSGVSRGSFAARKALELHPDVFDGGLISAGGGAGEIAVLNNKLNALFALKTLVDPQAPLKLVNIDVPSETAALTALVAKAGASPQGRARLALAAAIVQFARWTDRKRPKPAPGDYEAQLDQTLASFGFAIAIPVRAAVEKLAGGNVSWNTDVDYGKLLADSGRQEMVASLYAAAEISLADDLRALAEAPRISADPDAVARVERLMTYTGKIRDPLVNVDNDDPVDPMSDKLVYRDLLRREGTDPLFRLLWSDRPGHVGMSSLDRAVGFSLLIDRIDNGEWADSGLPALRRRAEDIRRGTSVDLGELYLYEPENVPPAASTWDASNWGTYRGP